MEIASIKGDTVLLVYHPAEAAADVGQQFSLLEAPEKTEGLIVQVISNDSLEYAGLHQEMIQQILEQRATSMQRSLDREEGMGEMKNLKIATAKIRKRVNQRAWIAWDGWIPTRHVDIQRVEADRLLANVMTNPSHALSSFSKFDDTPIALDGPRLNMVNVVTGVKGSGKSHIAKHLILALSSAKVPCIIYDVNGEYTQLPNAQVMQWGNNYLLNLADVGYGMLISMVQTFSPLQAGSPSEAVFENRLPTFFTERENYCNNNGRPYTIDIPYLRTLTANQWGGGEYVVRAIQDRLDLIEGMGLFWSNRRHGNNVPESLNSLYEKSCSGFPIIFDMSQFSVGRQRALVKSVNQSLESICGDEKRTWDSSDGNSGGRYPFVFFEEAHFYVNEETIVNIITRGRHIGMASVFVTNTPQKLPDTVFRQLDNLFLLSLTHRDDIRNVSKNSFTDEATIESFATRMPKNNALFLGNVTDRYPLIVKVDDLPDGVPRTGRTRSTWDRFTQQSSQDIADDSNILEDDLPF